MRTTITAITTLSRVCLGSVTAVAEDEATSAAEPAVYVSGTFENTVEQMPEPVMNPDTGVLEIRDGHLEFTSEGGDPRLADPYVIDPLHMDIDPQTGVGRMWGTGHYEDPEGSWEGAIWGLHYPISEEDSGYTGSGWLTGSGAYEGLVYFYRGSFDGEESVFEGIVYAGEAPPLQ